MDINNLEYPYQSFIQILIQNPLNLPLTLVKGIIGYAQQDVSTTDYQTTKYRVNELTEFMDAYTSNYLTQGTSETFKKLYCLNLTKQQENEYKSQQKRFRIPFDTSKFSETDTEFLKMFNFEHTQLSQEQFEHLAKLLIQYKQCYATSKFDVGKVKVELNLPLKATAVFKKQRATRIPLQLQEKVQHLLVIVILTHFDIIAPVNTDSLTTGNTFINPVIILKKGESLRIVLDARQLNTMIDETKWSWPIEPIQIILTRIKGPIFSIADMNSAYNQLPLGQPSQRLTNFVIAGQQYCFKRLFYGISIGPAAFSSFMSSIFKPLIRKNKVITYLDDVFIQDTTADTMLQTLEQCHNILYIENLKAAPDKSFFFLNSVKFLGHQIQNNHIYPIKSKIDSFLKLQPPKNKKEIQNYVGFLTFISIYIYNLQVILRPFYPTPKHH